jgi:hypothetical protein
MMSETLLSMLTTRVTRSIEDARLHAQEPA